MSITNEVREVFRKLPTVFVSEKADDLDAAIQIELSGEGASLWAIKIADGNISVAEGRVDTPNMTLQMEANDYLALTRGEANPMNLFATGKIRFQGDLGLAMRFQQMFRRQ